MIATLASLLFGTAAALALAVVWLSARSGVVLALALLREQGVSAAAPERDVAATRRQDLVATLSPARPLARSSPRAPARGWPTAPPRGVAA